MHTYKVITLRWYETLNILHAIFSICDRVCIKGPLVWRYKTEISAVKVYLSVLVGFREIRQSGSLLDKKAVDSSLRLISKLESTCSRNQYFSWRFYLEILKQVMQQRHTDSGYFSIINQIMKCLFNYTHIYQVVFSFRLGKICLESTCSFSF